MKGLLILLVFVFTFPVLESQPYKRFINEYVSHNYFPLNIPLAFVQSELNGDIDSIKIFTNDTIKILVDYNNNKIIDSDSSSWNFNYKNNKIYKVQSIVNSKLIYSIKILHIFPYILVYYGDAGPQLLIYKGLGGINKVRNLSGVKTMTKSKMKYCFGRIKKIKFWDWSTVGQKSYYYGYSKFRYYNDTTIVERNYASNDSLSMQIKYVFDRKGNILAINKLIKKRYLGWGIDATYYAYDGNVSLNLDYEYVFDKHNNWLEKTESLNDTITNKITRNIYYSK